MQTISTLPTKIQIYKGTYSNVLRLSVSDTTRFMTNFTIALQTNNNGLSNFILSQTTVSGFKGRYYIDLRIGAPQTLLAGTYSVFFTVTNGPNYSIPPRIIIQVTNDVYVVQAPAITDIKVALNGYSLPVIWNLSGGVPVNSVKIETDI